MNIFNNIKKSLTKYRHSYGDQIVRTFITSKFAKSKINDIIIMMSTIMLRNVFCVIFCIAFHTGSYYFDFILESIISILCLFSSTFIYDGLYGKKEVFYKYTKYYINHYTPANYRRWKRNVILPIALLFIIFTYFYEITSEYIRYLVWQSLLIYFIMDVIEHNKIKLVSDYIYIKSEIPKTIIKKEMVIEHGFMTMDKEEYKIKKAKEMYEKRLAYIETQKRKKEQDSSNLMNSSSNKNTIIQSIQNDIDVSCSSLEEQEDYNDNNENNETNKNTTIDEDMTNLEATYENIRYIIK